MVDSLRTRFPRAVVLKARDGEEALRIVESTTVHLVLTDMMMPGMNGRDLLGKISRRYPTIQTMAMTALDSADVRKCLPTLGTVECFEKPINLEAVTAAIENSLSVERLLQDAL